MKSLRSLAALVAAFGTALACSDMTALDPELGAGDAETGGKGASAGRAGSSGSKSALRNSGGASSGAGRGSAVTAGRATSNGGAASGVGGGGAAGSASPGTAKGTAGSASAMPGNAGAAARAGAGGAEPGSAGAGGSGGEPLRPTPPIFSEYIEGAGNNKALEVAIAEPGRLDGCVIRIYANGSLTASRTLTLSGFISPEAPFVICSPQLAASAGVVCDIAETLPFNGNDAVVFACDGQVVDSIGQLGSDPGEAGWGSGALRTQDRTLRRLCTVTEGDHDPSDAFDPSANGWVASTTDDFAGLGVLCEPTADEGAGGAGGAGAGGNASAGGADAASASFLG